MLAASVDAQSVTARTRYTLLLVCSGLLTAGCTPPPPAAAAAAPGGAAVQTARSPAAPSHWTVVFATAGDTEDGSRRLHEGAAVLAGVGADTVRVQRHRARLVLLGGAYRTEGEAGTALEALRRANASCRWLASAAVLYLPQRAAGTAAGHAAAFWNSAAEPAPGHYVVRCISLKDSPAGWQAARAIADELAQRGFRPARVRIPHGWVVIEVGAFRRYTEAHEACCEVRTEQVGAHHFDSAYVVQLAR